MIKHRKDEQIEVFRPAAGRHCDSSCIHKEPSKSQALCTVCHRTFATVGWFDRHRVDGCCATDRQLKKWGLVERRGLWATAEQHTKIDGFVERVHMGAEPTFEVMDEIVCWVDVPA